ncbi:MAG: NAD(+)/NADH kinase [Thermofilaceae archaeon]
MPLRVFVVINSHFEEVEEARKLLALHGLHEVDSVGEADLVIALGDDRCVLDAVQAVGERDLPILGVSTGGAGYLTSISVEELGAALEAVVRGEYELATYTKLKGVVDGSLVVYALNEIAVFPSKSAALMSYELLIDGDPVWSDRADGVIIATPLGSTAYALSAGGAIVFEGARVLEVVPVNSVDVAKRPLVIPDTSTVELRSIASKYPCEIVADGGSRVRVKERVTVARAETDVRIVRLFSKPSVRETLREKLAETLDVPPSAKFVLKMLELKGPMSARELAEETMLPERTVRRALSELQRRGLIRRIVNLRDARQFFYEALR